MKTKLYFIRKAKALFERFKLHVLIRPFESFLLNLVYLSKLSRWISKNRSIEYNDFYCGKVDYPKRTKMYEWLIEKEGLDKSIDYLEFGVAEGTAFKWWVEHNKNADTRFYGFDTFTGLPEDFGVLKKNDYDTGGNFPDVKGDTRCQFKAGLFQDSLPGFLKEFEPKNRKVIHMDADLYSSTIFVLTQLVPFLNKDDIIIFDEFGVPMHEFRAFQDFFNSFYMKFELLSATNNYLQIAIKLI